MGVLVDGLKSDYCPLTGATSISYCKGTEIKRMTSNPQSPPHDVLEAFELCEQFADYLELPVDYVWQEFGDPGILSCEELMEIFSQY
jgi:hypothetical protein